MRKSVAFAAAIALVASVQSVVAQEATPRELYMVGTYDVAVAHGDHFAQTVGRIAQAAKKGQVKGGVDWYAYRDGARFLAVFPLDDMAELDDVQRGEKAWQGTAGEADYKAAMAELGGIPYAGRSTIVERKTELEHVPAEPLPGRYIEVVDYVVQPGKTQEFETLAKDAIAVMREAGYPYRVHVYRTVVGDSRHYNVVTFFDSREAFYGKNSLGATLRAKNALEKWNALMPRYQEIVERDTRFTAAYDADISYLPAS